MKFVYCGNDPDFVGVPTFGPDFDFLTGPTYVCLAEIVAWEPSFWKKLGEIDTKEGCLKVC
ncbi:hypothetical protein [Leptospira santarosai]|uniref:hypothetical protein n=1 Tax=Leptospira santarosai TaxID=28183 RepID=UPI000A3EAB4A